MRGLEIPKEWNYQSTQEWSSGRRVLNRRLGTRKIFREGVPEANERVPTELCCHRLCLLSIKEEKLLLQKDQASKLPREECNDYVAHMAKEDYKNLTSSELQTYQHMADNVNKESKKYHALHKPKKVSVFHAMLKERTANRSWKK